MQNKIVETVVGALVLVVAVGFGAYAFNRADVGQVAGYEVQARFNRVDGLAIGNDVRIAGVRVGQVVAQELDRGSFEAVVRMAIDPDVELPDDTAAKISSESLLGGKYVSLEPGGGIDMLADGDEIEYTQGSVSLEELIGQVIYSSTGSE